MVRNRNNNTFENHDKITLNKDDDIGGSQIPVMWQCISITIPLAKQVQLGEIYACLPLCFHLISFIDFCNFFKFTISAENSKKTKKKKSKYYIIQCSK